MSIYTIEASKTIAASAEHLYAIIADYKVGHPAILPKAFDELIVTKGGTGAGTEIIVRTKAFGQTQTYNMIVSEPELGRVIKETDTDRGTSSTFIVDGSADNKQSTVTIHMELLAKAGILGAIEKAITRAFAGRMLQEELQNLADYAAKTQPA